MANSDVWDTIEEALEEQKERIPWEDWGLDSDGHKEWRQDEEKLAAIDAALAHVRQERGASAGTWQPVDYIQLGDGLEIHADEIAMTIGRGNTALATHAWPDDGQYAICRRAPSHPAPAGQQAMPVAASVAIMIDWATAPEKANWLTVDKDGLAYWAEIEPVADDEDGEWLPALDDMGNGQFWFAGRCFLLTGTDWRLLKQSRPGGVTNDGN